MSDPNATDTEGSTPLTVAAHMGHTEAVRALLDIHAIPHKTDASGRTPKAIAEVRHA